MATPWYPEARPMVWPLVSPYISEDRRGDGLVLELSVRENMSLCALGEFIRGGKIDIRAERQAVGTMCVCSTSRPPSQDQLIKLLSGGNQQKVAWPSPKGC